MLDGCAGRNSASFMRDESMLVETPTGTVLDRADLSAEERTAFDLALAEFGRYLTKRFGVAKIEILNESIIRSSDYYESLNETYETNPVFLFLEYSRRSSPRDRADPVEWLTSVSDHFVFQYHPGSAAERDIEIVKREAENALIGACADLGFPLELLDAKLDSLVEMRDSGSGLFYVKQGEMTFTDGRIPVVLTEDWQEYRELGGSKYTSGFCRFGAIVKGKTLYYDRLIFRYLDVFQLITLTHEVVHAVHFLAPAAESAVWSDYLNKKMEGGAKTITVTSNEFLELAHPVNNDKYLAEGLATWYMVHHGLVPKAMGIPDLRRMTADAMPAWKNVDLNKIIQWKMSLGVFEKAATLFGKEKYVKQEQTILYLGAGCFIEYILAEFGPDTLHSLMSRTKGNASDRIRDVFGMDTEEMDRRWKQWIMDRSNEHAMQGESGDFHERSFERVLNVPPGLLSDRCAAASHRAGPEQGPGGMIVRSAGRNREQIVITAAGDSTV